MLEVSRSWIRRRRLGLVVLGAVAATVAVVWALTGRATDPVDSYARCVEAGNPVMESNPPICRHAGRTYRGPLVTPTPAPPAVVTREFDLLVSGDSGGTYPQRQEVIRDQAGWAQYWKLVHAGLPSTPPLIPVDFTTSNVVALSEGRQPTGGYNLKITSITTSSAGTLVSVTEQIPTVTCAVTQAASNRYFIARTPKLTEPVSFRITTDRRRC